MEDVVQTEQIVAFGAMNLDTIRELPDMESVKVCLARLSGFQKALEEADRFFEMAVEFAKYEAAALIRACELGGSRAIKGDRGKAAKWLFNKSETEREQIIAKCGQGLTITQVYRQEVKGPVGRERIALTIQQKRSDYIADAEEMGIVDISKFSDFNERHDAFEKYMWDDAKQGLRRALLQHGFIGTGQGEQTYVNPNVAGTDQIKKAIQTRLESIQNDISSVMEIAHAANLIIAGMPQLIKDINDVYSKFSNQ